MKRYEPGWISVKSPEAASMRWLPVPPPLTIPGGSFAACNASITARTRSVWTPKARALVEGHDLLQIAPVGLNAGIAKTRCGGDVLCERDDIGDLEAARSVHADIDIDKNWQRPAGCSRDRSELRNRTRMIGNDGDVGAAQKQSSQPVERINGIQGSGDENSRQPAQCHGFGLADRSAGYADRAGGRDPLSDLYTFVRLRMGAERDAHLSRTIPHHRNVAVEIIDVDQKRWRWNVGTAHHKASVNSIGVNFLAYSGQE